MGGVFWEENVSGIRAMKYRIGASLALLTTMFALAAADCSASAATPRAAVSEEQVTKETELLERRFFPKTYWNDPLEKRIERLELMIYGASQSGSMPERLDRLKKDVMERSKTPPGGVPKGGAGAAAKSTGSGGTTAGSSSSQYPVLNTLEWRALKKTFPAEALDQRLARLESHLFGQPSATMPYVDRIDRLKRVMGLGMTSDLPTGPLGPSPKARPRTIPFSSNPNWINPSPFLTPDLSREYPGMDGEIFGGGSMNKTMSEMMRRMRQQMAEMHKLGPGAWTYDPQTRSWVEKGTGRRFRGGDGGLNLTPFAPGGTPRDDAKVPPYLDPNSI